MYQTQCVILHPLQHVQQSEGHPQEDQKGVKAVIKWSFRASWKGMKVSHGVINRRDPDPPDDLIRYETLSTHFVIT